MCPTTLICSPPYPPTLMLIPFNTMLSSPLPSHIGQSNVLSVWVFNSGTFQTLTVWWWNSSTVWFSDGWTLLHAHSQKGSNRCEIGSYGQIWAMWQLWLHDRKHWAILHSHGNITKKGLVLWMGTQWWLSLVGHVDASHMWASQKSLTFSINN